MISRTIIKDYDKFDHSTCDHNVINYLIFFNDSGSAIVLE